MQLPGDSYVVPFWVVYYNPLAENRPQPKRNYIRALGYGTSLASLEGPYQRNGTAAVKNDLGIRSLPGSLPCFDFRSLRQGPFRGFVSAEFPSDRLLYILIFFTYDMYFMLYIKCYTLQLMAWPLLEENCFDPFLVEFPVRLSQIHISGPKRPCPLVPLSPCST